MPRTILLDANVINQLNRGNTHVARALKDLLASDAKVLMSLQGFKELTNQPGKKITGWGPDNPRTAIANKKLLRDLKIPVARKGGTFGVRKTVYGHKGAFAIQVGDQIIGAQAKALNAEVWSFDRFFNKDPRAPASFGIQVAPESQLPFVRDVKVNHRRARELMELKPPRYPRGKRGVGRKGTTSTSPPAVARSGVIEPNVPKAKASSSSTVVGSRSTEDAARGIVPQTSSRSAPLLKNQASGPDVETTKLKRPSLRLPKGLIIDLIIGFAVDSIISDFEQQISELNQYRIKSYWADKVYPNLLPLIQAYVLLEKDAPGGIRVDKAYIEVDWEVLLREQDEGLAAHTVWFFKFSSGNPGYVELFEDVNYIGHREVFFSRDQQEPKRRRDRNDDSLIHEKYRQYILIWDRKIHLIANKYRKVTQNALEQLDVVADKVQEVSHTLPPQAQSNIDKFLRREGMDKIANALYENNYQKARRLVKQFIHGVRGQLVGKVPESRIKRIVEDVNLLRVKIGEALDIYLENVKGLEQEEKDLLSMFLGQRLENLR